MLNYLHEKMVFSHRVAVLGKQLAELLPEGSSVLDIGCGDGSIAQSICARRPDLEVRGIDVLIRPELQFPVLPFDGEHIPLQADAVDYAMFVDVLHHTENPTSLLQEAGRVARRGFLIKDHLCENRFAHAVLRFMDWVGNRAHGVALPYNYQSRRAWNEMRTALHMEETDRRERLNLYGPVAGLLFDRELHFVARWEFQ